MRMAPSSLRYEAKDFWETIPIIVHIWESEFSQYSYQDSIVLQSVFTNARERLEQVGIEEDMHWTSLFIFTWHKISMCLGFPFKHCDTINPVQIEALSKCRCSCETQFAGLHNILMVLFTGAGWARRRRGGDDGPGRGVQDEHGVDQQQEVEEEGQGELEVVEEEEEEGCGKRRRWRWLRASPLRIACIIIWIGLLTTWLALYISH